MRNKKSPPKPKKNPNKPQEFSSNLHWFTAPPVLPRERSSSCLKALPNWGSLITRSCYRMSPSLIWLPRSANRALMELSPGGCRGVSRGSGSGGAAPGRGTHPHGARASPEAVGCQMHIRRVSRNLWLMAPLTRQELNTRRQLRCLPFHVSF